jgi:Tol biopolymer transport system component
MMLRGGLAVVPVDSGAPRLLLDPSQSGQPTVEQPLWSADGREIFFKSHDARGNATFWSVPATGGSARLLARFDDPARPSYRPSWALGRDRFYFTIEDRQSDVWVMDVAPR